MTAMPNAKTALLSASLLSLLHPCASDASDILDSFPRYEIEFQELHKDYMKRVGGSAFCHLAVATDPATGVVVRTHHGANTGLQVGDTLVSVGGSPFESGLEANLKGFRPDETVPATVRRDGAMIDQALSCSSSEPVVSLRSRILKYAGRSKWHLCYKYSERLARLTPPTSHDLAIKFRCAQNNLKSSHYSRMMDKLKIARTLAELRELQIETAMLTGSVRPSIPEFRESIDQIRVLGEEALAQDLANQLNQLELRAAHWVADGELIRHSVNTPGFGQEDFAAAIARYDNGELEAAFDAFLTLARRDNAAAQFNLARMYEHGTGVGKDLPAAAVWYEKAASNGVSSAHAALMALARREAEAGTAFGSHTLGNIYFYGLGVEKDPTRALQHYRDAAGQDYPASINKVAGFYDRGLVLERDRAQATMLYHRAAALGHSDALYNLGVAYAKGHGVKADPERAYAIFSTLAARGDNSAEKARQEMADILTEQQKASAQALAIKIIESEAQAINDWKEN